MEGNDDARKPNGDGHGLARAGVFMKEDGGENRDDPRAAGRRTEDVKDRERRVAQRNETTQEGLLTRSRLERRSWRRGLCGQSNDVSRAHRVFRGRESRK